MIAILSICNFPWWLLWLLPFILGLLAGWGIWSRWKSKFDAQAREAQSAHLLASELQQTVSQKDRLLKESEKNHTSLKDKIREIEKASSNVPKGDNYDEKNRLQSEITKWKIKYEGVKKDLDDAQLKWKESQAGTDDSEEATWKSKFADLESKHGLLVEELHTWKDTAGKLEREVKAKDKEISDITNRYSGVAKKIGDMEDETSEWKDKYKHLDEVTSEHEENFGVADDLETALVPEPKTEHPADRLDDLEDAQGHTDFEDVHGASQAEATMKASRGNPYASIPEDNLKIVEGIGPVMEEVLKENGISTIHILADKTSGELQNILDKYGDKYRIIDVLTWPDQARLASNKRYDDLIKLQKHLQGGVEEAAHETPSKLEEVLKSMGLISPHEKNDLTAVSGIGPKVAELLEAHGINTWDELSRTTVTRLQEILDSKGSKFSLANPTSWPEQARLAADGRFDEMA